MEEDVFAADLYFQTINQIGGRDVHQRYFPSTEQTRALCGSTVYIFKYLTNSITAVVSALK